MVGLICARNGNDFSAPCLVLRADSTAMGKHAQHSAATELVTLCTCMYLRKYSLPVAEDL